jgi:hypothetical protein
MEEVGVRPTASRYMRVVSKDETISDTDSTSSIAIFRATLRNGQMFAVDPRNAMYNFTTTAEHEHGVFEWNSYMECLLVADRVPIGVLPLERLPQHPVPLGNLANGHAGNFVTADIRFIAESKAISVFVTLGEGLRWQLPGFLPLENYQTSFAKLMRRSSTNDEHKIEVSAFKEQLKKAIRLTRCMRLKEMLFDRLRLKEGN